MLYLVSVWCIIIRNGSCKQPTNCGAKSVCQLTVVTNIFVDWSHSCVRPSIGKQQIGLQLSLHWEVINSASEFSGCPQRHINFDATKSISIVTGPTLTTETQSRVLTNCRSGAFQIASGGTGSRMIEFLLVKLRLIWSLNVLFNVQMTDAKDPRTGSAIIW